MLDFVFNAVKRTENIVRVVLVNDINKIDEKRLVKNIGKKAFDELKTMVSDINNDGVVDKKDLLAIQSHVFGYSQLNQG